VNCEGWSNEAGLGILSNRQEDGSHVGVAALVSGRLGLRQATTDKDWDGFARWVSRGGGVTAWATARWVSLASHSLSFSLYYSLLSKFVSPLTLCLASAFLFFFFKFVFPFVLDY